MEKLHFPGRVYRKTTLCLAAVYLTAVAVRFSLALLLSDNPWIMPDESLYSNLARSLWSGGQVLLRGQPIKYDALLYPLVISPLYGLGSSIDTFRSIQLLNSFLINAWIFPMWHLSRRVTQSDRKAWAIALICLILPDMALNQQIMAENLAYPLISLLFLLAHRMFSKKGKRWEVFAAAVLCALLYYTKSGLIAIGAALCALIWYQWLFKERNPASLWQALSFTLTLLAAAVLLRMLTQFGLGVDYSSRSIYQQQVQPLSVQHLTLALQGMLLYAFFFPACCLVLPVVVPLAFQSSLDVPDRRLFWLTMLSLVMVVMGIAYIIYVDEMTANPLAARIHIRYLSAFIPLLLMLGLSDRLNRERLNRPMFVSLTFIASCAVILTAGAFLSNRSYPVDALILSPIAENWLSIRTKPVFSILLLIGLLVAGRHLYLCGWTPRAQKAVAGALSVWMLLGNVSGYDLMMHNRSADWAADAVQAAESVQDQPFVFVAEDGGYFWNDATALDVRLKKDAPFVELDDLLANAGQGGTYLSFLPKAYWTETPALSTGQAEYLVMDNALLSRIVLNPAAETQPTEHGNYVILRIPEDRRWVHSAFSGFGDIGWVREGSRLTVFDDALNAQETIIVSLRLYAPDGDTELTATNGSYSQRIPVGTEYAWTRLEVPVSSNPTSLYFSSEAPVYIQTYTVE